MFGFVLLVHPLVSTSPLNVWSPQSGRFSVKRPRELCITSAQIGVSTGHLHGNSALLSATDEKKPLKCFALGHEAVVAGFRSEVDGLSAAVSSFWNHVRTIELEVGRLRSEG